MVAALGAPLLGDPLPVALAAPGPSGQNDAGSGTDAPDSAAEAFVVASASRKYSGNLTPVGSDLDWYRHLRAEAFCASATITLTTAGVATLTSDPLRTATVGRFAEARKTVGLTLAAPFGKSPHLGIEGGMNVMSTETGPQSPGRYTFALQSFSLADLDPQGDGEGADAGPTGASSSPLAAGCSAGRLAVGDAADAYHLDVADARDLTISLARARGTGEIALDVVGPDGSLRATIESGGAADVWASEPGRWLLIVRHHAPDAAASLRLPASSTPTAEATEDGEVIDYLLGLTDGPGSNPCRPSCQTG